MKFYSTSYGCNLHETVTAVNRQGLADFVYSFHGLSGGSSIVIFALKNYDDYLYVWKKQGATPVDIESFRKGILYVP